VSYRHVLSNGIRVVGEFIPTMRSVSIGIWIGTGSRFESGEMNGISHFLEHMLFKGTDKYSARELAEVFDSLGGQVNAFTSKEYTCFYARVLDEHFHTTINALANMLFHSTFREDEVEKEKKVVIEEIRMYEDTPDELVMDILSAKTYGNHPLGYTILGEEENLQRFTQRDLFDYIASHYTSNRIVVSVAGNIAESVAVDEVKRLFGHAMETADEHVPAPVRPGFSQTVVTRQKDIEQVHLGLCVPGLQAGDKRLYPLILLNNTLGNTSSSRLFQEIREERGMAYSVFSFHSSYQDCGMYGIYAGTSPEHVQDVLALIHEICGEVAEKGLTEEEILKGKEQVKGSMMLSLESTSSRMSRLGKNELLLGREVSLDETIEELNAVTSDDIRRIANEILSRKFSVAAVGPISEEDLLKWTNF
jgi:predicted Zn-dependent peptidase